MVASLVDGLFGGLEGTSEMAQQHEQPSKRSDCIDGRQQPTTGLLENRASYGRSQQRWTRQIRLSKDT